MKKLGLLCAILGVLTPWCTVLISHYLDTLGYSTWFFLTYGLLIFGVMMVFLSLHCFGRVLFHGR